MKECPTLRIKKELELCKAKFMEQRRNTAKEEKKRRQEATQAEIALNEPPLQNHSESLFYCPTAEEETVRKEYEKPAAGSLFGKSSYFNAEEAKTTQFTPIFHAPVTESSLFASETVNGGLF